MSLPDTERALPCFRCGQECRGDVLRIQEGYLHPTCMLCLECNKPLVTGGFFMRDDNFYCSDDYRRLFGTRCHGCGEFVEGDVVMALEKTYHQRCFVCHSCRRFFAPGASVVMQDDECLCEQCFNTASNQNSRRCGGCDDEIMSGQALLAMHKQWHPWCFCCQHCGDQLTSEYMGKDGIPYCERDYHDLFGVKCVQCNYYVTGRVLQAGDNYYHPHCSRCNRCGEPFGEGEDMYLMNDEVWHPECGQVPNLENEAEIPAGESYGERGVDIIAPAKCVSPLSTSSTSSAEPSPATTTASELSRATRLGSKRSIGQAVDHSDKATDSGQTPRQLDWRSRCSFDSGIGTGTQLESPAASDRKQSAGSRSLASGNSSFNASQSGRPSKVSDTASPDESFDLGMGKWQRSSLGSESRRRMMSRESSESELSRAPITEVIPLEVLQGVDGIRPPKSVDRTRMEEYLNDEDFAKVFDMPRDEFNKLQVWKRRELKKKKRLF